jgi:hypothetical protein
VGRGKMNGKIPDHLQGYEREKKGTIFNFEELNYSLDYRTNMKEVVEMII